MAVQFGEYNAKSQRDGEGRAKLSLWRSYTEAGNEAFLL